MTRSTRLSTGAVAPVSYSQKQVLHRSSNSDGESESTASRTISASSKSAANRKTRAGSDTESESDDSDSFSDEEDDLEDYEWGKTLTSKHRKEQEERRKNKSIVAQERQNAIKASKLYSAFLNLPLEVLLAVLSFADPAALLSLAFTCKYWHNYLYSKQKSLAIWQAARINLTFSYKHKKYCIPEPPQNVSEPAWALVTCYSRCIACGTECETGMNVELLLNLCYECNSEIFLSRRMNRRRLAAQGKGTVPSWIFRACTPHRAGWHRNKMVFSIWEVEKVFRFYRQAEEKPSKQELNEIEKELVLDHDNLIKLSAKVSEWHRSFKLWREHCDKKKQQECIKLTQILLTKLLDVLDADDTFEGDFKEAVKSCYKQKMVVFPPEIWLEYALDDNLPASKMAYKLFQQSIAEQFQETYKQLLSGNEEWETTANVRRVLVPWLDDLRERNTEIVVWPGPATIASLEPCSEMLSEILQLNGSEKLVGEIMTRYEGQIIEAISDFSNSIVRSVGGTHIQTWFCCKICGDQTLTVYDLGNHRCLNYRTKHLKDSFHTLHSDAVVKANIDQLVGRVLDPNHWQFAGTDRSHPINLMRAIIPEIPNNHLEARKKRYRCMECAKGNDPIYEHLSADYKTIIACYFKFQANENVQYERWANSHHIVRHPFYLAELNRHHLKWTEALN